MDIKDDTNISDVSKKGETKVILETTKLTLHRENEKKILYDFFLM